MVDDDVFPEQVLTLYDPSADNLSASNAEDAIPTVHVFVAMGATSDFIFKYGGYATVRTTPGATVSATKDLEYILRTYLPDFYFVVIFSV